MINTNRPAYRVTSPLIKAPKKELGLGEKGDLENYVYCWLNPDHAPATNNVSHPNGSTPICVYSKLCNTAMTTGLIITKLGFGVFHTDWLHAYGQCRIDRDRQCSRQR